MTRSRTHRLLALLIPSCFALAHGWSITAHAGADCSEELDIQGDKQLAHELRAELTRQSSASASSTSSPSSEDELCIPLDVHIAQQGSDIVLELVDDYGRATTRRVTSMGSAAAIVASSMRRSAFGLDVIAPPLSLTTPPPPGKNQPPAQAAPPAKPALPPLGPPAAAASQAATQPSHSAGSNIRIGLETAQWTNNDRFWLSVSAAWCKRARSWCTGVQARVAWSQQDLLPADGEFAHEGYAGDLLATTGRSFHLGPLHTQASLTAGIGYLSSKLIDGETLLGTGERLGARAGAYVAASHVDFDAIAVDLVASADVLLANEAWDTRTAFLGNGDISIFVRFGVALRYGEM